MYQTVQSFKSEVLDNIDYVMNAIKQERIDLRYGLVRTGLPSLPESVKYSTRDNHVNGGHQFLTYNINGDGIHSNMNSSYQFLGREQYPNNEVIRLYFLGKKEVVQLGFSHRDRSEEIPVRSWEFLMGEDFGFQYMLMDLEDQHAIQAEIVVRHCIEKDYIPFNINVKALSGVVKFMKECEERYENRKYKIELL